MSNFIGAELKLDFSDNDEFDIEWFYSRVVLLLKVFIFQKITAYGGRFILVNSKHEDQKNLASHLSTSNITGDTDIVTCDVLIWLPNNIIHAV